MNFSAFFPPAWHSPARLRVAILVLLLGLIRHNAAGQGVAENRNRIVYDFGDSVNHRVTSYIGKVANLNPKAVFYCVLTRNTYQKYTLSVVIDDASDASKGTRLIREQLVKKTNRFVRPSEKVLLPLLFPEDFSFVPFEETKLANGKTRSTRVLSYNESYNVVFDNYKRIIK